ncbi:hypothetical protein Pmani_015742 [Petrolisthes manimaculis]|uniref:Uncharacterized protein n=1 Tax=Petrolisthes manimaculis TaxID=1843537 RepID=A0AAE1PRC9_9EUCA|nr:hypothetical protein Pmani_015742 [Petrolisthes manimaculis]
MLFLSTRATPVPSSTQRRHTSYLSTPTPPPKSTSGPLQRAGSVKPSTSLPPLLSSSFSLPPPPPPPLRSDPSPWLDELVPSHVRNYREEIKEPL